MISYPWILYSNRTPLGIRELFLGAVGLLMIFFSLRALNTVIIVAREKLVVSYFGKAHSYSWNEFSALRLVPTFFNTYNIQLDLKSGKTITLLLSFIGNQKDLTKSIIEACVKENPSIELNRLSTEAYGSPPFGYFD